MSQFTSNDLLWQLSEIAASMWNKYQGETPVTTIPNLQTKTIVSAASINNTVVKATSGYLHGISLSNQHVTVGNSYVYLKLYNKTSAVNVASDIPKMIYRVMSGNQINLVFPNKIEFNLGIAFVITDGVTNNNNTPVSAENIVGTIIYE